MTPSRKAAIRAKRVTKSKNPSVAKRVALFEAVPAIKGSSSESFDKVYIILIRSRAVKLKP